MNGFPVVTPVIFVLGLSDVNLISNVFSSTVEQRPSCEVENYSKSKPIRKENKLTSQGAEYGTVISKLLYVSGASSKYGLLKT